MPTISEDTLRRLEWVLEHARCHFAEGSGKETTQKYGDRKDEFECTYLLEKLKEARLCGSQS